MTDYKKIDKNLQSTNDTSLCPNCNHTMNIIVYCYYCGRQVCSNCVIESTTLDNDNEDDIDSYIWCDQCDAS